MSLVGKTVKFVSGYSYNEENAGEIIKVAKIIDKFAGYEKIPTRVPSGKGGSMEETKYAPLEYYSVFSEGKYKIVPCQDLKIKEIINSET